MACNLKNKIGKDANITKDIRGIRQTRGGHLLVKIKQGSREVKNIVEKLKVGMTGKKIKIYGKAYRKVPLNVYGIDIDMKEGQIHDDMLEVKALRPLNGGRQAVTILVSEKVAEGLEYKSTVKLGWPQVEIRKKDDTKWCYRCWKDGHISRQCKGPDRTKLCRNYGEGHQVKDCTREARCLDCDEGGQRTPMKPCRRKVGRKIKDGEKSVIIEL
ncbi:hypothetical protein WA026_023326 [Henosepilachna vigintioctopunctata]|uniref:CCHC-type domain-containing protein n=1 Tax=Henosepilachna vigintioctopunctata TaxID=420089 RepID=A0AAW1US98_9CUCU